MPRLRNATTGVVVNVSDEAAARLEGFEPIDKPAARKAPAKKAASKKSESDD